MSENEYKNGSLHTRYCTVFIDNRRYCERLYKHSNTTKKKTASSPYYRTTAVAVSRGWVGVEGKTCSVGYTQSPIFDILRNIDHFDTI